MHSGFEDSLVTLDAISKDSKQNILSSVPNNVDNSLKQEFSGLSWKKDLLEGQVSNANNLMEVTEDLPFDVDLLRKYSADDGILREPELRKRTLSIMLDRINGTYINIYQTFKENEKKNDKTQDTLMNFLEERKNPSKYDYRKRFRYSSILF